MMNYNDSLESDEGIHAYDTAKGFGGATAGVADYAVF